MAIVLSDNIQNNAPKPTDSRYLCNQVPYTSVSQANSVIAGGTGGVRYTGLTVNIGGDEYWYKNGIGDGDLIPKVLGGEGNGTVTGATNGLTLINSGTTAILGGVLTGDTSILFDGIKKLYLGSGNTHIEMNGIYGSDTIYAETKDATTCSSLYLAPYGGMLNGCIPSTNIQSQFNANAAGYATASVISNSTSQMVQFSLGLTGITVCTNLNSAFKGIQYDCNYSANYQSLSIPHVGWVTGYTQSAVTQNSNTVNVCNVTTNYSATTANDFIGVSGGTLIYLPNPPKPCQRISIADIKGDALGNNIIICSTGMQINGNSTATINTDYGSITFINNGYSWSAVAFIN